jgi:hypothetical protein
VIFTAAKRRNLSLSASNIPPSNHKFNGTTFAETLNDKAASHRGS